MKKIFSLLYIIIALPLFSSAGSVSLNTFPNNRIHVSVSSLSELRKFQTIRQKYDFSCGGAALTTVLRYQYGLALSEEQVVQSMLINGDQELIKKRGGFSLLDLKRYANALGFNAVGYKLDLESLQAVGLPVIIPIQWFGFRHFVVFRGYRDRHVVLADPSWGNLTMREEDFVKSWDNGIAFVIYSLSDPFIVNRMAVQDKELIFLRDEQLAQMVRQNINFATRR
ncbi:MAG: C39 family peptidase [Pseudomonadota bacterium]